MKQIRQNVFETNSSSTHAFCISKSKELDIPEKMFIEFGEFGWEFAKLDTPEEKASYLYTGFMNYSNNCEDVKNQIFEWLSDEGIDVEFQQAQPETEDTWHNMGYIDHGGEYMYFINDVVNSKKKLMRFLFNKDSFVLTGNDNSDDPDWWAKDAAKCNYKTDEIDW